MKVKVHDPWFDKCSTPFADVVRAAAEEMASGSLPSAAASPKVDSVPAQGTPESAPRVPVSKLSNPKDALAVSKLPLSVVPSSLNTYAALAFLEGALKYGRFNWRAMGVSAAVYIDAMQRHVAKWLAGQECDPVTHVPHLASAIACLAIIIDARLCGKLTDDRPPMQPALPDLIDESSAIVQHLQALFADFSPKQYTIADGDAP